MHTSEGIFKWPQKADLMYRIMKGALNVDVVLETEHTLVFHDPRANCLEGDVRLVATPKQPLRSMNGLQLADAPRWADLYFAIKWATEKMGWSEHDGFRLDIPVNPPYQQMPWTQVIITKSANKPLRAGASSQGYTRDPGHMEAIVNLTRGLIIVGSCQAAMAVIDPDDRDNLKYDHAVSVILRRQCDTIVSDDFTEHDWLAMTSMLLQASARLNAPAYHVYINVGPPYQHTQWVHAHLLVGAKAIIDLGDPIALGLNVSAEAPAQHTSVSV